MMVMGLDGATVGPDGGSRSLSGPADLAALLAIRSHCDAVVIGAETLRVERYKPFRAKPEFQESRAAQGIDIAPRLVIVSASLKLPWEEPVFTESALRPIVATVTGHDADWLARARDDAEVLVAPGSRVDPEWLLDELYALRLHRIACEGGRGLLASFADAGVIDEWDVTLSGLAGTTHFGVADAHSEDGFLFTRFTRDG
ncbi:MAG: dihydrofolate reductase family protein, partial [Actinomycetota bacterium]